MTWLTKVKLFFGVVVALIIAYLKARLSRTQVELKETETKLNQKTAEANLYEKRQDIDNNLNSASDDTIIDELRDYYRD